MLKFRPHHFLCTLGFQGKGYSPEFVEGYQQIQDLLFAPGGDHVQIIVTTQSDSICEPCPHRVDTSCDRNQTVLRLDQAHATILGLSDGDQLTWREAKERLAQKMSEAEFHRSCEPCSWKRMGVCESALKRLKAVFLFCFMSGIAQGAPLPPVPVDAIYQDFFKKLKKGVPEALVRLDQAHQADRFREAGSLANELMTDSEFSDYGFYFKGRSQLRAAEENTEKREWKTAQSNAEMALEYLGKIASDYPQSPFNEDIQLEFGQADQILGDVYSHTQRNDLARQVLEKAFFRFLDAKKGHHIRVRDIENYLRVCTPLEKFPSCQSWLLRLGQYFPDASVEYALLSKGDPTLKTKVEGLEKNQTYWVKFPSPDSDATTVNDAIRMIHAGDESVAKTKLTAFLKGFSRSQEHYRALYWLGKIYQKDGDEDEARTVFQDVLAHTPLSFYGMLAAFELKMDPGSYVRADLPGVVTTEAGLKPHESYRIKRAEKLLAVGARTLAGWELEGVRPHARMSNAYLMHLSYLNHLGGNHAGAFASLTEMFQRRHEEVTSTHGMKMIFPAEKWEMIRKTAQNEGVDPILLLSLVKQESAFRSKVVSASGALGLTQVMPFTAVEVSPKIQQSELTDATTNLQIGTRYLAKMLQMFNGKAALALAGYNAGPHRVREWQKTVKSNQTLYEFIETIPFSETRTYVSGIMRNYHWYLRRIEGRSLTGSEPFWTENGLKTVRQ